jgi:cephalosporin-C deacetylase-like acetyl esterase
MHAMNFFPSSPRLLAASALAACAAVVLCSSCVDLAGSAPRAAAPLPVGTVDVPVPELATPLADGWLPAEAWRTVSPIPFCFLDGTGDQPQAPTLTCIATRAGQLLLRVECQEPDMPHLLYTTAGHDANTIWRDDSIEFYLQPGDGAPIYHLVVNPAGARYDAVATPGAPEDDTWDPPLRVRTALETGRWTAEFAVPLTAFLPSNAAPAAAGIWRANICRARQGRVGAFAEDTGWLATKALGAGDPEHFGRLHLQALRERLPLQAARVSPPDPAKILASPAHLADLLRAKFGRAVAVVGNTPAEAATFRLRPLSHTSLSPFEPTDVRIEREPDALRITARCRESAPAAVRAAPARAMWEDDSVEIFLTPNRKESGKYLHFVADRDGKLFTGRGTKEASITGVQVQAKQEPDSWTVSFRIPDAAFDLAPGHVPALWGLNVTRFRAARRDAPEQNTVWSRFLWSAHTPAAFGTLWLSGGNEFPDLGSTAGFADAVRLGQSLAAQLEPLEPPVAVRPFDIEPDVLDVAERQALSLPSMVKNQMNVFRRHLFDERDAAWAQVQTTNDFVQLKARLRAGFVRSIGGFPEKKGPLNARASVVFENDEVRIERLIYDSQPGFPVTANLFVPKQRQGRRLPVIVRIEGHTTNGRFAGLKFSEDLARSGYMVMNIDLLGQGERIYVNNGFGSRTPTSNHYAEGAGLVLTGANLAGLMVYDVMRGLDYLETREEADMRRVVLTGASGGGTVTAYVTALDDRIAAAAPVSACGSARHDSGGSSDSEQVLADNVASALDVEGFATMACPRPYCVITEATPEAREITEKSFDLVRRFYAMYGAGDRLKYVPTKGPHGYGKGHVEHFRTWLQQAMPPDADGPRVSGKMPFDRNACTASRAGRVYFSRDLPGCETIFSLNARRMTLASAFDANVASPDAARVRAAQIRTWLQQRFDLPAGGRDALRVESRGTNQTARATVEKLVFTTDDGIVVPALLLSPREDAAGPQVRRPVVVWLASRGKRGVLALRADALAHLLAGQVRVLIPDVRATGESAMDADDTFMGEETDLNGFGFELGRPIVGQRVKDVLACVRYLRTRPDVAADRIALLGDALSGCNPPNIRQPRLNTDAGMEPFITAESLGPLLAVLGAALDPQLAACATTGLPSSYAAICSTPYFMHATSIFIPGILQVCDIPDLCATVAPRPLLVGGSVNEMNQRLDQVGTPAAPFDRTLRGYRLAGAEQQLVLAPAADATRVAAELVARLK